MFEPMRWLVLLSFLSFSVYADEWKASDKAMLGAAAALLVVDWGQTRDLTNPQQCVRWVEQVNQNFSIGARQETYECRQKKEYNPILGEYPSRQDVDRYFAAAILGTAAIAYLLPSEYRKYFLGGVIVLEVATVLHNHSVGLRVNF